MLLGGGTLGATLEPSWAVLAEPYWGHLGAVWGHLWTDIRHGGLLGRSKAFVESSWAVFGPWGSRGRCPREAKKNVGVLSCEPQERPTFQSWALGEPQAGRGDVGQAEAAPMIKPLGSEGFDHWLDDQTPPIGGV